MPESCPSAQDAATTAWRCGESAARGWNARWAEIGSRRPVVMLKLLKFRAQANYPAGSPHAPCSGAEAYRRYQTAFVETVGDVSRAEVVWEGRVDRCFIGDASQDWDKCLLVRYRAASTSSR